MREKLIIYEKKDNIATITLNRAEKLNSLHPDLMVDLIDALDEAENDQEVHVIIITGSTGSHGTAFCAGYDLTYSQAHSDPKGREEHYKKYGMEHNNMLITCWNKIAYGRKPVIAAVDGWCLGGGSEMMISCDIVIASENAKIGFPEIRMGGFPGSGGPIRTPRLVLGGKRKAKELIWTGEPIDANEALRIGLVNKVAPAGKLEEVVNEFAKKIASKAPKGIQGSKYVINKSMEISESISMDLFTTLRSRKMRREPGYIEESPDDAKAYRARFKK